MKTHILSLALATIVAAAPAQSACYADYKAKRDNPLRLHYGVIELVDAVCSDTAAIRADIERRIAIDDWTVLNVVSVFDEAGLEERQESAGNFYLKY